jgi:tRNA A-37 threonylcarbamoyl transferase component Bud32
MEAGGVAAIDALARGRFDVLGELGRDDTGNAVWLARGLADRTLVALRLDPFGGERPGEARLEVSRELDASLPPGWTACPVCRKTIQRRRHCPGCGSDLHGLEAAVVGGASASQLVELVVAAAGASYEVLGSMQRAEAETPVVFARARTTGALVALSLPGDLAGEAGSEESVRVTRFHVDRTGGGALLRSVADDPEVTARPGAEEREGSARLGADEPEVPVRPGDDEPEGSVCPGDDEPEGSVRPRAGVPSSPGVSATNVPAGEELKVCPVCGGEYGGGLRFCPRDASILQPKRPGDDNIGKVIGGRYHVLAKIGEGGMGQVYLAEHVLMGRRCALKMIKPGLTRCVDSVSRFSREANNASRINHPNVVVTYDFGEAAGGVLYLAMEYVDGESLASLVARESPLPVARAVEIARQVADALTAAHHIGVVHRDLKPDNILLARNMGGGDQVKVVDFGIAKGLSGGGQDITRTGCAVGTPRYMSPEQLMGERVDGRSDLYSVGCVLYEVLTGREPFGGGEGAASLARRLVEPTPHPRSHRAAVSRELNDVVVRALACSPADRYQSAAELRDALAAVPDATDTRSQPRRPPRRRPPAVALAATGADDAAAVVARRKRTYALYLAGAAVLVLLAVVAMDLLPGDDAANPSDPVQQDAARMELEQARLPPGEEPDPAGMARLADVPRVPERVHQQARTVPAPGSGVTPPPALSLGSAADFGPSTEAELEVFRQALVSRRFGVLDRLMRAEQVDRLRSALAEPGALHVEAKIISSHPEREAVAFFVEIVDAVTGRARFFGGYRALFVPVPGGWKLADVSPDQ